MDRRLLLVDDDPLLTDSLEFLLRQEGYEVTVAASGSDALQEARTTPPDLVLLDVNLPGMSGVEAAAHLSSGPVVVLLSTYDEDEFDSSGCGAAAYVSKSVFSPERLQQVWQESQLDQERPAAGS